MMNLADHLNTTGNEWAVAITKSVFFLNERKRLVEMWELVGIKSVYEVNVSFSNCLVRLAGILYPQQPFTHEHIILLEAKPGTFSKVDPTFVTLALDKSVANLIPIDSQMEAEVREISVQSRRFLDIYSTLFNLKKEVIGKKQFTKEWMAGACKFDVTSVEDMIEALQADSETFNEYVGKFAHRVCYF